MPDRINLGALHARRVLFYTREAAAILYEVCSRLNNAEEEGQPLEVPSLDRLWIGHDGALIMETGHASVGTDQMPALASLIELLLPPPLRGQPDYAVPSSFRVLAPRARRFPPGLPPMDAPGDLAAAINRYRRGQSSTTILQGLYVRTAGLSENSPSSIETGSFVASSSSIGDGEPGDQLEDTRDDVRPLDTPALVWPPSPESINDVWVLRASEQHTWQSVPEDLPLAVDPVFPENARTAVRPMGSAATWLLGLAAMLLAFAASYEVTHLAVSGSEGQPAADEKRPLLAATREKSATTPRVPTEERRRITHEREMRAPAADAHAFSAAPLALPASTGPVFSPSFGSGSSILFHAGRDPAARLMMADLGDRDAPLDVVTIVNGDARNYHPRLSPDQRYLAFDSDRDGVRGVYVANRDGHDLHRVSGPGFAAVPTWAPNMRWLAFVRGEPGHQQVWNLWLHDFSTGADTRLTSYPYGQTWGGTWFPDSRRLCYSHEDRLVILDIENGRRRAFASPRAGRLVRTPAVSPDGRRIAFQVMHDGAWLLDVSSGAMRRLIDDASAEEFAWAADGRHLAYHSHRGGAWRIWLATIPNDIIVGP